MAAAQTLAETNPAAQVLVRAYSAEGQAFLAAVAEILERPETQEVVSRTLNAIGRYFSAQAMSGSTGKTTQMDESTWKKLQAASRLAAWSEQPVKTIFARSTAIGSLMRLKIDPFTAPPMLYIHLLL